MRPHLSSSKHGCPKFSWGGRDEGSASGLPPGARALPAEGSASPEGAPKSGRRRGGGSAGPEAMVGAAASLAPAQPPQLPPPPRKPNRRGRRGGPSVNRSSRDRARRGRGRARSGARRQSRRQFLPTGAGARPSHCARSLAHIAPNQSEPGNEVRRGLRTEEADAMRRGRSDPLGSTPGSLSQSKYRKRR